LISPREFVIASGAEIRLRLAAPPPERARKRLGSRRSIDPPPYKVRPLRSAANGNAGSTELRVFILYANPVSASFGAALHTQVVATLQSQGHVVDDCDLYGEAFDPVMGDQERMKYHDTSANRGRVATYANRLLAADALVLVYPVWNEGFPAILKGFFDRVFIPGVSFKIGPDGAATPNLQKLTKLAAVCTYGASRVANLILGDPPRRVVKRLVRAMPGHSVRCDYLAQYDMDHATSEQRAAFLEKVNRAFERW
jgi:NAD(P)H dehydrogenase (quinone)